MKQKRIDSRLGIMVNKVFSLILVFALSFTGNLAAEGSIEAFCSKVDVAAVEFLAKIVEKRPGVTNAVHLRRGLENYPAELAELVAADSKIANIKTDSLLFQGIKIMSLTCGSYEHGVIIGGMPEVVAKFCSEIPDSQLSDLLNYVSTVQFLVGVTLPPIIDTTPLGAKELIAALEAKTFSETQITGLNGLVEVCEEEEEVFFCKAPPDDNIHDFLWKPVSDSDGKLVILTNPTANILINDGEDLRSRGASNGRCTTDRAAAPGCNYGKKAVVSIETMVDRLYVIIPDGCNRYDCRGSIYSCGLELVNNGEVPALAKKIKKLKNKLAEAKLAGRTKKIKQLKLSIKAYKRIQSLDRFTQGGIGDYYP